MSNPPVSVSSSELSPLKTLPELFAWRVARSPDAEAYRHYDDACGAWLSIAWREVNELVADFIRALARHRLESGSRVAILLPNGLNAVCADQAILALGLVPVPMHALDNPASIGYILQDSDAALLLVENVEQWQGIAATKAELNGLQQVVIVQGSLPVSSGTPELSSLATWLASAPPASLNLHAPKSDDLAALVYTSGTTGKPKGVMLTHANVMANVIASVQRVAPLQSDVFLSFLPLSHSFERTAGYYLPIAAGACVAFSRSVKQLPDDLLAVRPTILISVPRVYERFYSVIQTGLAESRLNSYLFNFAIQVGWRRFRRAQHILKGDFWSALLDGFFWLWLQPLVAQKITDRFGGRLRVAVSGGAALSTVISHCFLGLGIPLVQGYGMTETAPVVAFNAPDDNDPSTVGRVLNGVDVRIGENAELQVRGANVMRGYWKRPIDTENAFSDGWLRTGDQAEVVEGRVRILGRLKEIIVTSTGEKIAPVDLELAIMNDYAFEQVYVFGDDSPFIGCAVVLNRGYWAELTRTLEISAAAESSLRYPSAHDDVLKRIHELTQSFPYYAQPKAVILSLEPWTVENTLITPTLKLKRKNLAAYFSEEIKRMYSKKVH